MALIPKAGLFGYPSLVADENAESWLPVIHELYPNGDLPLAGLFLSIAKEKAQDATFHWWEREYQQQTASFTAGQVYTNVGLSSAYSGSGTSGDILYVKMGSTEANYFAKNNIVQFTDQDKYEVSTRGMVVGYQLNGTSSYVAVKLLQDDTAIDTSYDIRTADTLTVIGHSQPQAGTPSESKSYSPTKRTNVTGILDQTLDISRTLLQSTTLRTGNKYEDLKMVALQLLMQKLERSLISGWYYEGIGENNQPQNVSGGIEYFLKTYYSDNIASFNETTDSQWAGQSWLRAGKNFLDTYIEQIFRVGESQTRLAVVGSQALQGLADLAHAYGEYNLEPTTNEFGLRVTRFNSPNGTIDLKKHPLWSADTRNRHRMMIIPTENISAMVMQDITFHPDEDMFKGGLAKFDGKREWFLTELGWKIMHPETFGDLYGIGLDNSQI